MTLYPPIEPYRTGALETGTVHQLYFEECGSPTGKPVVFVHGGPGGGTSPEHRRFFDPDVYRIVLLDQRGCGRSVPHAHLEDNTTWDLVADLERLRRALGIDSWMVFGGSWGSTLALAYAEAHPSRVTELVLRGIFLLRRAEVRWYYQEGASFIFPDAFERFRDHIPEAEQGDLVRAYHARLTDPDARVRIPAAQAWSMWEGATSRLIVDPDLVERLAEPHFAEAFARIECHYFVNEGFMVEGQLLRDASRITHIPCVIVQGRYDVVCPMQSAWDLAKALPHARLEIVGDAGHAAGEPGIAARLVAATDFFRPSSPEHDVR